MKDWIGSTHDITSTDDGMNTDGGVISVFSSSGDGADSNGDLTINGCELYVEANAETVRLTVTIPVVGHALLTGVS